MRNIFKESETLKYKEASANKKKFQKEGKVDIEELQN